MCRGGYHATSDDAQDGGVCNGMKSQLEVLYNTERQESLTRAEALQRFTSMNAEFEYGGGGGGNPAGGSSSGGGGGPNGMGGDDGYGGGLHEQTQAVLISPALIFKDKSLTSAEDDGADNKKQAKQPPLVVNPILNQHNILPEEELILRQEWHCYGSTEVEYLVLQDEQTGERKIVAVAPHNTGISRRTIESDDSIRAITRVGLGWLDIIHDNHTIITPSSSSSSSAKTTTDTGDDTTAAAVDPNTAWIPGLYNSNPGEVLATAKEAWQRTYTFSSAVAEHMKWNGAWLSDNLRDEFPQRTYQAGQKIVTQLPITIDLTANSMRKIVGFLREIMDHDDEDDDDNDTSNDAFGGRKR